MPQPEQSVDRLRQDAAMMVAGIDADRRSIMLAAAARDSATLREAEASLRAHTERLSADIAALSAAGDATLNGLPQTSDSTVRSGADARRVASRR